MILRWGEIRRAVSDMGAVVEDPKVLRPFARRLQDRARKFIEGEGEGAWPPFAESTLKKRQQGTSNITKFAKIRVSKIRYVESRLKAIAARGARSGFGDKDRKKIAQLKKRLATLKTQAIKAEGKKFSDRKIGKRVAETTKMMPRMPGSIRVKIKPGTWESTITCYSKAGIVGLAHHEGLGNDPQRIIVPEPSEEDMDFLVNLLEDEMVKRFDEGE